MTTLRMMLALVAKKDFGLLQVDVKRAFFHGHLDEEVYVEQRKGYEVHEKMHLVCKLKKSLYGPKQCPRKWYETFDAVMMYHGYNRYNEDYVGTYVILILYVDDILIVGEKQRWIV